MSDLDVFPLVEQTALQVVVSNGRADVLQTLNAYAKQPAAKQ